MVTPKKPTSSKIVYENPWIKVHEDQTVTPDGNTGIYGYLESRDSVAVVAVKDSLVCLLKAFRYPTQSWGWELPGGGGDGEEVVTASRRELEEETGIISDNWQVLGKTIVCNGLMTERMTTCLALDCHEGGTKEVSDEVFDGLQFFSLEQIDAMIDSGDINDGQTITGLYLYRRWLEK